MRKEGFLLPLLLTAWDPVKKTVAWRAAGGGGIGGGTLTTAGNLVFQVVIDGRLLVYSADKGEKLLELATNKNGMGAPITYMIDGKQYIAFQGGAGRPARTVGPNDQTIDNPPMLFVFEVGGTAALPTPPAPAAFAPPPAAPKPAAPKQ
ncbi:MAG: PQQ-dependent dehydrogenase, methanol/ethanol family, partial [Acidobacteriota bacterium]